MKIEKIKKHRHGRCRCFEERRCPLPQFLAGKVVFLAIADDNDMTVLEDLINARIGGGDEDDGRNEGSMVRVSLWNPSISRRLRVS